MSKSLFKSIFRKDILLAFMLFSVVLVMIIPIHRTLMDVLIALNMTLSILILMTSIYIKTPLGFATFPSVVLIATTMRIALSVATTRLILTKADGGSIIKAFGDFAISGNVVVGLIIFLIITIIQFVVITKGAERIAEVSARFKLDALPGRQMSIEADSKNGDMTREEIRIKRDGLSEESQYFGSMDGAMKFVKGDAVAGLIITAVNLLGGIFIGVGQLGLPFGEAVYTFSLLTVGDGLVAQIPALFIALSAGTIVTRVAREQAEDLGTEIASDLFSQQQAVMAAAAIIFAVGVIPGFPFMIFAGFACALVGINLVTQKSLKQRMVESGEGPELNALQANVRSHDRFAVACGSKLFASLDLAEFTGARIAASQAYEKRIGVPLPYFGIRLDPELAKDRWEVQRDSIPSYFAHADTGSVYAKGDPNVMALATKLEPELIAFPQHRAYKLPKSAASDLRKADIETLSLERIMAETCANIVTHHNGTLFGMIELEQYLSNLTKRERQFFEHITDTIPRSKIVEIFSHLLVEQVPVAPRAFFLDSLAYTVNEEMSAVDTARGMRYLVRRQICRQHADEENVIGTYIVDRDIDIIVRQSIPDLETGSRTPIDLNLMRGVLARLTKIQQATELSARKPVIMASEEARQHLRAFLFRHKIYLPVLSHDELADEFVFEPLGMIELEET